ncbi:hypothetical protein [Burkholderia thailandensis]|uniref:Uncharacterized protein n=2 Tax=Burkholderia thailandensis TaxID=57975 RepID=A0AAW9CVB2_BURTH|nr:hypothetical protein [Burkholderia thailandensis]ABC37980.1 conserved hypothetical protein [Burkholderia thailandensis E264]AHI65486.1 hypothetical protein BTL_411 [Burkholderia thailandensis H0587]AHI72791.1 hypothetical protein BTQ_3238 [Burkholderia thailandensis 2002721723]AHI77752.1 hypothetical protein BTJ_2468 [Burkholderia thailandensis E444]AIC85824.1 hypothetical protein BTRA_585 [Burkholderia thailandensis USAMRU Malaysia \
MDGWVVIGIVLAAWIAGAIVFVHRASAVFFQALGYAHGAKKGKRRARIPGLREAHE